MQQYPPIKIKPNTSPHVFIERLAEVANELDGYAGRLESEDNETLILHLDAPGYADKELEVRIVSAKRTDVKHVHLRLMRPEWKLEMPEYEVYTEVAQTVTEKLLKDYNRRHKTRLRLNIKSLDKLEPQLTPKIRQAFEDFSQHAHKDVLGGRDWERYYRFIRLTHAFQVRMDEEQIFYLLASAGFAKQYAREISDVYMHGRALLANKG